MNSLVPMTGQHSSRVDADPVPPGEPARGRLPDGRGTGSLRIAGGVVGRAQRCADHLGHRVDRRADRQVDDAARMRSRQLGGGQQRVPREGRQPCRQRPLAAVRGAGRAAALARGR